MGTGKDRNANNPFKGTLARRLIFVMVLASSLLAFIMTGIQLYMDYRADIDGVGKKLHDIERGYRDSITQSVWVLDEQQIGKQLKGIVAIPGIYSVAIEVDGKTRWQASKHNTSGMFPRHYRKYRFELEKIYKGETRKIGEVVMISSLDEIYASLYDKMLFIFLTNALKTFLVSLFLFFFVYVYITRRISRLADYARNIELGANIEPMRFDTKWLLRPDRDEIDNLLDAINTMRNNLDKSYRQLQQVNEKLNHELEINAKVNRQLARSRDQIEKKERELDSIISHLVEGVLILDRNLFLLRVNQAARKMFGLRDEDIQQLKLEMLIPMPGLRHRLDGNFSHPRVIESFGQIHYGHTRDGSQFPLRLSLVALPDNDTVIHICTILDITLELQKEEQLQRSQKMDALGKLTGGIAHDYNNMLGVIRGYAELIQGKVAGNPDLLKYVQAISHAADRGSKLTAKLLSFTRNRVSDADIVDINMLLHEEQHILEKTLTPRIRLVFDLADNLWPVQLDRSDFEDAVLNIAINAMHAIEGAGLLTIQTRNCHVNAIDAEILNLQAADYVRVSFTDTGCGIRHDSLEKIFDPFFTTKGEGGTGLGLSQVYGFMERSNGQIKVHSQPGQGSCFELFFPRHRGQQADKSDSPSMQVEQIDGTETILLVDDEPALLDLTEEILTSHGYRVLRAETAEQALRLLEKDRIDLMLSDVIMPEMDGYALAHIVHERFPATRILLSSGFSQARHVDQLEKHLHDNMLHKPYRARELLQRIRAVFSQP